MTPKIHNWQTLDREKLDFSDITIDQIAGEIAKTLEKMRSSDKEDVISQIDRCHYGRAFSLMAAAFDKHAKNHPAPADKAITKLDAQIWYSQQDQKLQDYITDTAKQTCFDHPGRTRESVKLEIIKKLMVQQKRKGPYK